VGFGKSLSLSLLFAMGCFTLLWHGLSQISCGLRRLMTMLARQLEDQTLARHRVL